MRTRQLGWTHLELTTIGLGTWAIGGGEWAYGWGPQDDKQSMKTIHQALDLGINWIDTAAVYGLGHSEEIIGKVIKECPHTPYIATKCGLIWNHKRKIKPKLNRRSIKIEAESSLKRLQVDVIDLYQIHWPKPENDIEEAWTAMAELKSEGKIRYGGVSNFDVKQMKRLNRIERIASLQPPYSMLRRDVENEILNFCSMNEIGVISYSPMQRGLLTGKITRERVNNMPQNDHRKYDDLFSESKLPIVINLVSELEKLSIDQGYTVSQLAIAWVMRQKAVTSAIVGARQPEQIVETAQAAEWVLDERTIREIDKVLDDYRVMLDRLNID